MYHIFVFSPLVEMLSKKYPALITLICFPISYCKDIQFSKLFLHTLSKRGELESVEGRLLKKITIYKLTMNKLQIILLCSRMFVL
jgi:hypothetical protein